MSGAARRPARVRTPYVEQLADRLSPRDWSIVFTVDRLRLTTGSQLERLHFDELTGRSRSVKRGQVLKRLVVAGVLVPLPRRVGTALLGSVQQSYALDSAGQQLVRLRVGREARNTRVRRPRVPSDRLTKHTLAVSELYVELVERSRQGGFILDEFQVEGNAYWPDGLGGWMKPDAYVRVKCGTTVYNWWYEADMPRHESELSNESLPTIQGKLLAYLHFARRGQRGPDKVVPWVLFGVPTSKRCKDIQGVIDELPAPAQALFRVAHMRSATQLMIDQVTRK